MVKLTPKGRAPAVAIREGADTLKRFAGKVAVLKALIDKGDAKSCPPPVVGRFLQWRGPNGNLGTISRATFYKKDAPYRALAGQAEEQFERLRQLSKKPEGRNTALHRLQRELNNALALNQRYLDQYTSVCVRLNAKEKAVASLELQVSRLKKQLQTVLPFRNA